MKWGGKDMCVENSVEALNEGVKTETDIMSFREWIGQVFLTVFFLALFIWTGVNLWMETDSAKFSIQLLNHSLGFEHSMLFHKVFFTTFAGFMSIMMVDFKAIGKWIKRKRYKVM